MVTIILGLLIGIAVPAYNALILATSESQATNSVQVALQQARGAALASNGRADAAAVFTFDPGGRLSILTCVEGGRLRDAVEAGATTDEFVERDVFAPVATLQPTQLPREWTIRGMTLAGTLHDGDEGTGADNGWYDDGNGGEGENYEIDTANWIFPETGFYDPDDDMNAGAHRQTFIVRFQGGTGAALSAGGSAATVLLPSPSLEFRTQSPYSNYRVDRATNLVRYVQTVLNAPPDAGMQSLNAPGLSLEERWELLGDRSIDTALARPVGELAVFNEGLMAGAIGANGLNQDTDSLYLPYQDAGADGPTIDTSLFGDVSDAKDVTGRINEWIMGTYVPEGAMDPVPTRARVFRVPRPGGSIVELAGN